MERDGVLQRMEVDFSVPCVPADLVMQPALTVAFLSSLRPMQGELKPKAQAFASILSGVRTEAVPRHCNATCLRLCRAPVSSAPVSWNLISTRPRDVAETTIALNIVVCVLNHRCADDQRTVEHRFYHQTCYNS